MKKRIEQKFYYKLQFSMGSITSEDGDWIREAMEALETNPAIMKCYQNTSVAVFDNQGPWDKLNSPNPDYTVYYRKESVDALDRFLFKMKLRFPNCVVHTTQTLQEYF